MTAASKPGPVFSLQYSVFSGLVRARWRDEPPPDFLFSSGSRNVARPAAKGTTVTSAPMVVAAIAATTLRRGALAGVHRIRPLSRPGGALRNLRARHIDTWIGRPFGLADEEFHTVVTGGLARWSQEHDRAGVALTIVGDSWDTAAATLRDGFTRLLLPFTFREAQYSSNIFVDLVPLTLA